MQNTLPVDSPQTTVNCTARAEQCTTWANQGK